MRNSTFNGGNGHKFSAMEVSASRRSGKDTLKHCRKAFGTEEGRMMRSGVGSYCIGLEF